MIEFYLITFWWIRQPTAYSCSCLYIVMVHRFSAAQHSHSDNGSGVKRLHWLFLSFVILFAAKKTPVRMPRLWQAGRLLAVGTRQTGTSVSATAGHLTVSRQAVKVIAGTGIVLTFRPLSALGWRPSSRVIIHTDIPVEPISASSTHCQHHFPGWEGSLLAPSVSVCVKRDCGQTTVNDCAPKHYITPLNVMPEMSP